MRKVLGAVRKADNDFKMIKENDVIAVGVSGGKDSMLLLYALHLYQKFAKTNFKLIGIHIKLGFPDMNFSEVEVFCKKHEIEFYSYPSQVYEILKRQANSDGTIKCSLCSKFKKALVIDAAKKHNCNVIAFAHHGDDAIETLFLNMIYGGKIATFLPKMYMSNTEVDFIRPFIYLSEKDIVSAVKQANIPIVPSTCPMDKHTKREEVKHLLFDLYDKYPASRQNFLLMLSNLKQLSLWNLEEEEENV